MSRTMGTGRDEVTLLDLGATNTNTTNLSTYRSYDGAAFSSNSSTKKSSKVGDTVHFISPATTTCLSDYEGDFYYQQFAYYKTDMVRTSDFPGSDESTISCDDKLLERTLAIIKPDALKYQDVVLRVVTEAGFQILNFPERLTMVMCFVPDCNHYSDKKTCFSWFRFPKDPVLRRKWITHIRRQDRGPTIYSLVCSCHFVNGDKNNLPTIFEHKKDQRFLYTAPDEKKRRSEKQTKVDAVEGVKVVDTENLPGISRDCRSPSRTFDHENLPGPSGGCNSSSSTSRVENQLEKFSCAQQNAEIYLLQKENEELHKKLENLHQRLLHLSPEQIAEIYQKHYGSPTFPHLVVSMSISPLLVLSLAGKNCIERWKTIVGPYGLLREEWFFPCSVRNRFGMLNDIPEVIHASDNLIEAKFENRYFFPKSIIEPIPFEKDKVADYINLFVRPALEEGLIHILRIKPIDPIMSLAEWLLLHNPYQPKFPEEVALSAL